MFKGLFGNRRSRSHKLTVQIIERAAQRTGLISGSGLTSSLATSEKFIVAVFALADYNADVFGDGDSNKIFTDVLVELFDNEAHQALKTFKDCVGKPIFWDVGGDVQAKMNAVRQQGKQSKGDFLSDFVFFEDYLTAVTNQWD